MSAQKPTPRLPVRVKELLADMASCLHAIYRHPGNDMIAQGRCRIWPCLQVRRVVGP